MHQRNQPKERLLEEMLDAKRASVGTTYQRLHPEFHTLETVINDPKEKARREMQELVYTPGNWKGISTEAALSNNDLSPPSPFTWWKTHHVNFPIIATLARKWLGCVEASVPPERTFPTAGNTFTKRRNALQTDTICAIIFIAQNVTDA
ncbi:hypothetical protein PHMEG_00016536 [Phytophthora megakarya]|uniref:HAT C-terminal dimerisation domain-containing protein n=1 Tax=Phytophthora megakarya TaxID=4795 RepID=A0A225W046_9STRA|nr:hypothetical protein PHMEG_00016536 [Phytophthora megakarya]